MAREIATVLETSMTRLTLTLTKDAVHERIRAAKRKVYMLMVVTDRVLDVAV